MNDYPKCPDCGHDWRAHQGRRHSASCHYTYAGYKCPCRNVDPEVDAEDRRAGALWRAFTGGSQ